MIRIKYILWAFLLGLVLSGCQPESPTHAGMPHEVNKLSENLLTGGQPSQAELAALKKVGVTRVINLRGPDEAISFNEKAEVEMLDMEYTSLPISGAADVTPGNARALYTLLQGNETVFIHCASGNRVGALLAIGAHEVAGKSIDESLEYGRAAGLGSLEDRVKAVLSNQVNQ